MPTDIMGYQCSTPNVEVSKLHLFSYKLRDTKQEELFSTAELNGLSHTPDTGVFGWLTGGISQRKCWDIEFHTLNGAWQLQTLLSIQLWWQRLKNQLQKRELAIIYQNKHNFGHTEEGLRESWAMSMISGMLHVQKY